MRAINAHYLSVAEQITQPGARAPLTRLPQPIVLVPVPGLNRAVEHTLAVARALSPNVTAIHVSDDAEASEQLRAQWDGWNSEIPLVVLESPFRSLLGPLLTYVDALRQRDTGAP